MRFDVSSQVLSWFHQQYKLGNLILKPPFQRRPVWKLRQKCYLVESVLSELPVPEIYIQRLTTPTGDTKYAIIDGQQRIRAILQFIGSENDPGEVEFTKYGLVALANTSQWKNVTFNDLSDVQKTRFFNYSFAVRFLDTNSDDDVRDMFRRLNKFLTPLNAQELRNATYSGPFVSFVEDLANDDYWAENAIVKPAQIRRMGDLEFMSELVIGVMHGPQGGSSKAIDDYYSVYEDFDEEFPGQQVTKKIFERSLSTVQEVLPDIKEHRWGNKHDFYSLFVALATLLRKKAVATKSKMEKLRKALLDFAEKVDQRLGDESFPASDDVVEYARAIEKGVNDKARRAKRHDVLCILAGGALE